MELEIFNKYFSPENLRLAWERVLRSTGRDIKDFFGIEIFATNLDKNLERLSTAIFNGQFKPRRPFKYYEPKPSKTHRTKSVLSIDDALVYQAVANIIATDNYKRLTENNTCVFGSVLNPEVEKGIDLLNEPDAGFFFFQYYIPLYNRFINSVNVEIENTDVRFKLETDITGFFDCIPHSKLLITLNKTFGVEPEILDLLQNCLNMYSGTRDSITPGVGIPQGPAASFFFANLFLYELDYKISQDGYTYYRYMDDIRIYDETEEKITEVLVLIDNYLKGKALSLNTKKTKIEEIGKDREAEKLPLLAGYDFEIDFEIDFDSIGLIENNDIASIFNDAETKDVMSIYEDENLNKNIIQIQELKTIKGDELINFCKNEIAEVEQILFSKFKGIETEEFDAKNILGDESLKKDIIHFAYRWRKANSALKSEAQPVLNQDLIPIWLFCLEHYFWKANHFCWNLNLFGENKLIKSKLTELMPKFNSFEWVRYQILSNMAFAQTFSPSELKDFFRKAKAEPSAFVRLGYYTVLLKHVDNQQQLFASLRQAIKDDEEPYIRMQLFSMLSGFELSKKIDELKFWFGL